MLKSGGLSALGHGRTMWFCAAVLCLCAACGDDDGPDGEAGPDGSVAGRGGAGGTGGADAGMAAHGFTQRAYLKAAPARAGAEFGFQVALDGDTLAVGVPFDSSAATGIDGDASDGSAPEAGAVYVFTRDGDSWSQQAYIKASNTREGDEFGQSVALDGDTLVVGAPHESSNATGIDGDQTDTTSGSSGAVYVFTRSGDSWSQEAYIKASNTGPSALFGASVALHGDTLAVGGPFEQSNATGIDGDQQNRDLSRAGAVYVFTRSGESWSQQAYIKASNARDHAEFGGRVALTQDTLAVGASHESSAATGVDGDQDDTSAESAGAVYVFVRSGDSWMQQAYLKASNTTADARFGFSLALAGDTLAIGAPFEENPTDDDQDDRGLPRVIDAGAVYVFTRSGGGTWAQQAYLKARQIRNTGQFGRGALALDGETLAVGAQYDPTFISGAGAVHIFSGAGDTWTAQGELLASNPASGAWFGQSVALSGGTLVVGAPRENGGGSGVDADPSDTSARRAGAVYVFEQAP